MLCLLVNDYWVWPPPSPCLCHKGYSFGKRVGSVDTLWLCHMSPLHPMTTAGAQQHLLTTHMPPSPSTALDTWGFLPPKDPVANSMLWSCLLTQAFSISKVWRLSKVLCNF